MGDAEQSFCSAFATYAGTTMLIHLSPIGLFFNALCIIGFLKSLDQLKTSNNNLFKYLLIKSICDAMFLIRNMLAYFYTTCTSCILYESFGLCYYGFGFVVYIGLVAALLSIMCEVAANFNRYRTITQKFRFMNRLSFVVKLILMLVVCFVYYGYWFFGNDCVPHYIKVENSTTNKIVKFNLTSTKFQDSDLFFTLEFTSRLVRDVICSLILISLNIMTLLFMRESLIRKRTLSTSAKSPQMKQAEQAQTRTTQMVLTSSLFTLIGHVPTFFDYLSEKLKQDNQCLFALFFTNIFIKLVDIVTFNRSCSGLLAKRANESTRPNGLRVENEHQPNNTNENGNPVTTPFIDS